MFFVATGSMFYRRIVRAKAHLRRIVIMDKKPWFCEAVLWIPWYTRGTMRALIESELILLDRIRFRDITVAHGTATRLSRGYAPMYVQHLTETAQKYGQVWDIDIDLLLQEREGDDDGDGDGGM